MSGEIQDKCKIDPIIAGQRVIFGLLMYSAYGYYTCRLNCDNIQGIPARLPFYPSFLPDTPAKTQKIYPQ